MNEVFRTLNAINVNDNTEKKNGLTYLSWAWAWAELKKVYPDATYKIRQFDGKPYLYDETLGYMVMTEMTVGGITHEMWLPVMDGANKAMKDESYVYDVKNKNFQYAKLNPSNCRYYDKFGNEQREYITKEVLAATMFDINTAIMRCLVKNIAMFGLGLYIYAGEDLPEESEEQKKKAEEQKQDEAETARIAKEKITSVMAIALETKCKSEGVDVAKMCELYKVKSVADLNNKQYRNINDFWSQILEKAKL